MNVTWGLLAVFSLLCHTESRCSQTSYYKNCWIRRFPGIFIDIEESQRRGAQLLKFYQEETALKCSRTCCLTRNFSCNLAIFHYDTTQENCFHLHCPTLESCILSHRGNVVLYNITKGVDPDLLVFGKYFTSNVRVLPYHYGRVNASEQLSSDKRQFIHPPPPAASPLTSPPAVKPSKTTSGLLTTTTTTTTTVLQSTSQPTTVSATTSVLTSTPTAPPAALGSRAQTTRTSSIASPTPTSTVPPSSTTFSPYNAQTTPASFSTLDSSTTTNPSTSTLIHHHKTSFSPSAISPATSTSTSLTDISSKQYSNETKGSLGRNHSAGSEGEQDGGGEDTLVGPGWHVAAHTLLVAVVICTAVLLSCCCSILLVVSWRGQRKRMGRYRTSWRGKRASMCLIKYALVRESP